MAIDFSSANGLGLQGGIIEDVVLLTKGQAFSALTPPYQYFRGFFATGAGNLVVTTLRGQVRTIPVQANVLYSIGFSALDNATTATGVYGVV